VTKRPEGAGRSSPPLKQWADAFAEAVSTGTNQPTSSTHQKGRYETQPVRSVELAGQFTKQTGVATKRVSGNHPCCTYVMFWQLPVQVVCPSAEGS
jgi:hypothetical protein